MRASRRRSLLLGELYETVEGHFICLSRVAPRTAALRRMVMARFTSPRMERKTGAASRCRREARRRTDWLLIRDRPLGSILRPGREIRASTVKAAGSIFPRMQEKPGGECWSAIVTFTTLQSTRAIQKYCTLPASSLRLGNQTTAVNTGRVSLDSTSSGDIA